MIINKTCPFCHSSNLIGNSIDIRRAGPHISRTECRDCGLIFANPMASKEELIAYYKLYYDKEMYDAMNYKESMLHKFQNISQYSR